jgi:molybdate transport system ATP-binding protein
MNDIPVLEVKLRHTFPGFDAAIDLSLGRNVGVLFGPSGAGKSVTLRMIAGLIKPNGGRVTLGGRCLFADGPDLVWVSPQRRRIGYVFQHHALFPHMTVLENIVYGARGQSKHKALSAARELVREFQLGGLEFHYPRNISGGQKQRVAFARALIGRPDLLLLDEPFSALDHPTRLHMGHCLGQVMRSLNIPVLLVTHDLEEAVTIATKMFICIGGRIHQQGMPDEIIKNPSSDSVRHLIQRPGFNQVLTAYPGHVEAREE